MRRPSVLLATGLGLVVLSAVLGALILAHGNAPFAIDAGWNATLAAWDSDVARNFSLAMNRIGGTWFGVFVVPSVLAIVLLIVRRPWAAAYFILAEIVSAGAVQLLKHLFGRARPEEILIISDYGSFPSGHVANAATIAAVAVVLFPRLWVVVAGSAWVLLMAFSRTFLHAHWLSDTLGGALIGTGVALALAAAFARTLDAEDRRRSAARSG